MNASINSTIADYLTVAANQAHGNNGNLTLLVFNATLGVITLDPSITNVSILRPAIGDLFSEDVFSIPQACTYPISGMRDNPRSQASSQSLIGSSQVNMASSIDYFTTS